MGAFFIRSATFNFKDEHEKKVWVKYKCIRRKKNFALKGSGVAIFFF